MGSQNDTVRGRNLATPSGAGTLVCPHCAKVLDGEPNFCPSCGSDLRGLGGNSDTLDGPLRETLIDGRYKLLEKLGEGGMGSVFKVEHARMGKIAALKLLRPDHAVDKGSSASRCASCAPSGGFSAPAPAASAMKALSPAAPSASGSTSAAASS